MQRFENKVVLITGAASGIGRASVLRIADEGGQLFCADLHEGPLTQLVTEVNRDGGNAIGFTVDISVESQVRACVQACIEHFGRLDAVINMAGVIRFDNSHLLSIADWQKVIDINLTGSFLLCKAALPHLLESRGNIVNAASTASLSGLQCGIAYAASKGGILAMTRTNAVEYAKRGVRANCVCPGDIQTGMTEAVILPDDYDYGQIGRIVSLTGTQGPETVAGVIAMLASNDGAHITGEEIRVDGGTLA